MASFKDDYDRFYCKYCDVTVKKNPAAMNQHLLGNRHKRNVALFLKKMRIKEKEEGYAERETQKELRRLQAITGIPLGTQPGQIPSAGNTFHKPPPGKVRAQQTPGETQDSLEEKINEAIDEAVLRVNEVNVDDYCEAAEAYYLKMNGNNKEGLEGFIKAARAYIINDIDAKSVENGEAAPKIGEWTVVEVHEENVDSFETNETANMKNGANKNDDDNMGEADAIFGTVGMNGTAQPRRPVGYHSAYDDDNIASINRETDVTVKKEVDEGGDAGGLFKRRKRKGNTVLRK